MKKKKPSNSKRPGGAKTEPASTGAPAFPIVGIGASAGGYEAFAEMLKSLPENTGMAFVFVQHLDPSHGSVLSEILSRTTRIPVVEVTDGMKVAPNHIYVIPANTTMLLVDGELRLGARTLVRGQHLPIDHFFHSLAETRGNQAIGVILSGTASDGTEGCRAIKAGGGITFAQDEESAKFSSMPRSAASAGCIDFVMPPRQIARELTRIVRHPYIVERKAQDEKSAGLGNGPELNHLLSMVREASGVDFGLYKQTTLQRRIKRRMVVHRLEDIKDYLRYVRQNPAELDELYRDILIHVTGFFRDKESYDALAERVFPALFQSRNLDEQPLRIWVPGCSTGEEAYSIAICLLEFLWEKARNASRGTITTKAVQIFATDISEAALDRARTGLYTDAAVAEVSPQRLSRFFIRLDGGYQINKSIREMCVFARQNVTKDPPFSNLDLITCRNLLIYLGPELQKRVIPTLHYALKPDGYLMLGGSESLGSFTDHFLLLDKKHKIYQKKRSAARLITYFSGTDYTARRPELAKPSPAPADTLTVDREVERVLVNRFVPASIVVNEQMEIVQFRGRTGPYLEPAPGHPTFSLSKMAREGLLVDLRAALNKAKKSNTTARAERVPVKSNGHTREVDLEVIPVRGQGTAERFYVIVFQDARKPLPERPESPGREKARLDRSFVARENERSKREVAQLREQLQSLIEDHETTSEEFKSANEEVLSANEELQSTNEELETAKEELQSSNEELTTLNEELQNRNTELSLANNDLMNLLGNVNIPVVMVGNDLRIRRFTPPAQKLLNLIPADMGRRLQEIRPNLDVDDMESAVQATIDTATLQEREVHEKNGAWYMMRVRPYKTWDSKIDGAVISFQDIDDLKRSVSTSRDYSDSVIENARESILIVDPSLRVSSANRAFYKLFQLSRAEVEGCSLDEIANGEWSAHGLREALGEILRGQGRLDHFEVRHDYSGLGPRVMLFNARRIEPTRGQHMLFLSVEDVTEQRRSEAQLRSLSAQLLQAQDEERRRIARDLHDSTGQKLVALKMTLAQADGDKSKISEAETLVDSALQEIRTLAQLLHPPLLEEAGLLSAARWLAEGFSQRSGVKVDLKINDGVGRLSSNVEIALFRVMQEALNNIHRHAHAKSARIHVAMRDHTLVLRISDDGRGMPRGKESASGVGVGLLGMRERLAQLGGNLTIASTSEGTTIEAEMPLQRQKKS
ncbi:MAG TPA: chemotaxis protein CheB [Terriglobales bacterium]